VKSLACLLGAHEWIRDPQPGLLRLKCLDCGGVSPGVPVPVGHAPAVVVRVRKLRTPKPPALKVVKRRTA
jgi:hypothetical protein